MKRIKNVFDLFNISNLKKSIVFDFFYFITMLCVSTEIISLIKNGNFDLERKVLSFPEYTILTEKFVEKNINNRYRRMVLYDSTYAKVALSEKSAHANFIRTGETLYSIQFCYMPLILEICLVDSWDSYCKKIFYLSNEGETYSIKFNMKMESNPKARFEFNLG